MRFSFEVGQAEPHKVEFYWGQMFGTLQKLGAFEIQLVEKWIFEVGIYEKHLVRIEKERAKLLAGLRPHIYRVFVDDELIEEHRGY